MPISLSTQPYHLLVLGDSLPWGQGLCPEEKSYSLIETALRQRLGGRIVQTTVMAHSGATLCSRSAPQPDFEREPGEMTVTRPTVEEQVEFFDGPPETVDLILLNGGIVDVSLFNILDPMVMASTITRLTEDFCHREMARVLGKAIQKFSNAQIVVLGYYPILSDESNLDILETLLTSHGVLSGWGKRGLFKAFEHLTRRSIIANCQHFADQSTRGLVEALREVRLSNPGGERAFLAVPPFTTRNAAFAPEPWLFGLNVDSTPEDPLAAERLQMCSSRCQGVNLERCYRASVGHPNPIGAKQYAKSIMSVLGWSDEAAMSD